MNIKPKSDQQQQYIHNKRFLIEKDIKYISQMSTVVYYQTDFKPDYELFQERISQLSSQKSKINKNEVSLQKLQHQLELIKQQVQDQGLQYEKNSILERYASIQEMVQKKKTASDCCVHCGQQIKKSVQCQLCAEIYCKNCCWRKRIIPFEQHQHFRLCCQQCHQKYIKYFNNQDFYKEKAIYIAAIDQLQRKYEKTKTKYDKKEAQVNQYKEQKRSLKLKQGNLKKALLQQEKKIKISAQLLQNTTQQKALKQKQDQQQSIRQQKQSQQQGHLIQQQKIVQEQRIKTQAGQELRKINQVNILREEQLAERQSEIRKHKQQIEKERHQLSWPRQKQPQQIEVEREVQNQSNKGQGDGMNQSKPQPRHSDAGSKSNKPSQKDSQIITGQKTQPIVPSKVDQIPNEYIQLYFDTILSKDDQKMQQRKEQPQRLKQPTKDIKGDKRPQQQAQSIKQQSQQRSEKHKDQMEQINQNPRLTMNQIKTMSINDLLSMKIPMNPTALSKQRKLPRKLSQPEISLEAEGDSTTTQNQKMHQSLLQPNLPQESFVLGLPTPEQEQRQSQLTRSFKKQEKDFDQKQKQMYRKDLLMRSSLMSSTKKSIAQKNAPQYNEEQTIGQPEKCACQIM